MITDETIEEAKRSNVCSEKNRNGFHELKTNVAFTKKYNDRK